VLPAGRVASGAEPEDPEGVGRPVSRVGTGLAVAFEPVAMPVSRVAVGELAAFGNVPVSWVALVELVGPVGRSVSSPASEGGGTACVVGPASGLEGLEGGAVTVASLMGSGCAVGAGTGLSAFEPAGLGSKAFTDGLSVGSGVPGLILIARGLSLMAFGAGSVTRACVARAFGARNCFVTLGLTIGAGAFAARGSTFVMVFFGAGLALFRVGLMARATGFCGIGFEARATRASTGLIWTGLTTVGVFVIPPNSNTTSVAVGGLELLGCSKYTTMPDNTRPCKRTLARIARRRNGSPKLEFGLEMGARLFKGLPELRLKAALPQHV
jgi:hypothetical protein